MAFSNPIIGGGNKLIRTEIMSPDFETGVSGWSINKDGTAEFNDVTVRGSISADNGNVLLNDQGILVQDEEALTSISPGGGVFIQRIPNDGAYGQIGMPGEPTTDGPVYAMRPQTPTPNGNTVAFGMMTCTLTDLGGGIDRANLDLFTPWVNGQGQTSLRIASDSSDGLTQGRSLFSSNVKVRNTQPVVSTVAFSVTPTTVNVPTTAQTNVVDMPGTYVAGRTYKFTVSGGLFLSVAGSNTVSMRFRLTSGGGTLRFVEGRTVNNTVQAVADYVFFYTPPSNQTSVSLTASPGAAAPAINYICQGYTVEEIDFD